ncbi:amine oxidase [flavin-containing]-like [Haemaphysalis longicornis]
MSKEIPTRAPWGAPNAEEWDKITYLEFIDRTCWTKTGRALAEYLIVTLAAAEAHEGSLLWLLWSIKQCGGIGSLLAVRNGAQEYKLEGGMMQVSEKIAESLKGSVHLSSPVASVSQTAEEVVVETTDGEKYRGSHCNLALAPPMQMRLHYSPPLPASRNQLLQRLSMGSVWKCLVYYKEAFWRRMGYTGCLEFTPYEDCILTLTLDDTKPDGKHPAIIGFLEGKRARSFAHMTTDERKQKMVDSLARAFCTDEALNPIHYEEFNWSADQYSGGCYTCVMPPGALTSFRGRRVDRLHQWCCRSWRARGEGGPVCRRNAAATTNLSLRSGETRNS